MSRWRIGIAVVVLTTLLSSAALARVHLGVGPLGVVRFAAARVLSLGGLHRARAFARRGQGLGRFHVDAQSLRIVDRRLSIRAVQIIVN